MVLFIYLVIFFFGLVLLQTFIVIMFKTRPKNQVNKKKTTVLRNDPSQLLNYLFVRFDAV